MEREAVARAARRRQALELLEDERERETALARQLESVIADADGPRLDARVFEQLEPAEADLLRELLDGSSPDDDEEGFELDFEPAEDDPRVLEAEIERLTQEIDLAKRRIHALERYLEIVDAGPG